MTKPMALHINFKNEGSFFSCSCFIEDENGTLHQAIPNDESTWFNKAKENIEAGGKISIYVGNSNSPCKEISSLQEFNEFFK
jgi:hypothetical protein